VRWTALCLGSVAAVVCVFLAVNYAVDLYGLFGKDARIVYTDDRLGKYLLSLRYVPERFDALLVGSSITDNWDTAKIDSVRMYNGSIVGGNISEAKVIADNVLNRKRLKVVVFCVYPYLTETHGKKAGGMSEREYWAAFGSLQLLRDYATAYQVFLGRRRQPFDEYGVTSTTHSPTRQAWWKAGGKPTKPEDVYLDPVAYSEYSELVRRARSLGALIVHVNPPIYYERWTLNQAAFETYYRKMAGLFHAEDPALDFNTAGFDRIRKSRDSFYDGAHLSKAGSDDVVSVLNDTIRRHCSRLSVASQARFYKSNSRTPLTELLDRHH